MAWNKLKPSGKAFEDGLVPQDPNDEPTSVLLERVRAEREAKAQAAKKTKKNPERKLPTRNPKTNKESFHYEYL